MNDVKALVPLVQKRTEGIQRYLFKCFQDQQEVIPDDRLTYIAKFATEDSLVKRVPMEITNGMLEFNSEQITDLAAGIYRLEIWEVKDDVIHSIYPSDRFLKFLVNYNVQDLPQGTVSSLTLDEFEKRFNDIAKNIKSGGTINTPKFNVGKTETVDSDQPASVEMIEQDDGTTVINFKIPKGADGKTWKPYIADDGNWHIKLVNPDGSTN